MHPQLYPVRDPPSSLTFFENWSSKSLDSHGFSKWSAELWDQILTAEELDTTGRLPELVEITEQLHFHLDIQLTPNTWPICYILRS